MEDPHYHWTLEQKRKWLIEQDPNYDLPNPYRGIWEAQYQGWTLEQKKKWLREYRCFFKGDLPSPYKEVDGNDTGTTKKI